MRSYGFGGLPNSILLMLRNGSDDALHSQDNFCNKSGSKERTEQDEHPDHNRFPAQSHKIMP